VVGGENQYPIVAEQAEKAFVSGVLIDAALEKPLQIPLMKTRNLTLALLASMPAASYATPITRNNTADALNLTAAWEGGLAPGTANTATWDASSTLANTMGAANTWGALNTSAASGAVSISGANTLLLDHTTDANTVFNTGANNFTWGAVGVGGNFHINGAAGSTSSTATGATFAGSGTVTISSNATKNWSSNGTTNGVTNVTFTGTLALRGAAIPALGTLPGNWLAFGGGGGAASDPGTATQTGSFALDTGDETSCGALILTHGWSGQFLKLNSLRGTGSIRADWGLSVGTQTRGIELDQAGDTTFSGSLLTHNGSSQRRNINFVKKGAGTLTFAGALGTSGGTASLKFDLQAGKIQLGNGVATPTIVGALDLADATFAVGSGTELVFKRSGTFSWPYIHSGSGTIRLSEGAGTIAFTGNSPSFSGHVQVDQGALRLGPSLGSATVTAEAGTIISPGLTATAGTSVIGSLILKDASESDFRIGTTNDKITVTGGVTVPGPSENHIINIFNDPIAGGTITLIDYDGAALTANQFSRFTLGIRPFLGSFELVNNTANTSIDLQITLQDQIWKGFTDGKWDASTANWALAGTPNTPAPFSLDNPAIFNDSASVFNVAVDESNVTPLNLTFNNSTHSYQFTGGAIAGTSFLTKNGSATVTLAQPNSYSGGTIINAGKLQIGAGGTTGDIGSGAVSIAAGSTLEFNRSNQLPGTADLDYKNSVKMRNVSGAGDIVLTGGLLFFNYTGSGVGFADANSWNNFTGNLTIKGGSEFQTIRNGATAMGTGSIILGDGSSSGILSQIEGNWTWTNAISLVGSDNKILNRSGGSNRLLKLQGVISGSGGLSFEDPASTMTNNQTGFILTGANTLSGTVAINSGVPLRVGGVPGNTDATQNGAGNSGSLGAATVVNNGTLTFSRSDIHTVSNNISGSGAVFVGLTADNTAQEMTYSGTASHTGGTTVRAGILRIAPAGSIGGPTVTVANSATLGVDGTSIANSASLSLGATGLVELTGTETVNTLFIDDVQMAAGTYGATGSGATFIDNARFSGAGVLQVTTGPAAINDFDQWAGPSGFNLVGGREGDDDGDGLSNFEEYAFGLNPTRGESVSPVTAPNKGTGTFTYTRRKQSLTGLSYSYESSTNLAAWPSFTPALADISNNGDPVETITVTLPASLLAEPKLFLRVKVVEPVE
jgi:autotransporter-associated beta strand protein